MCVDGSRWLGYPTENVARRVAGSPGDCRTGPGFADEHSDLAGCQNPASYHESVILIVDLIYKNNRLVYNFKHQNME